MKTMIKALALSTTLLLSAVTEAKYIYVGDSIAVMHRNAAKQDKSIEVINNNELAVSGKNPKWIYDNLVKSSQDFKGHTVILSSGYSNDPAGVHKQYHEKIIKHLLDKGATVRLLGLANNYYVSNRYGKHVYQPERYQFLKGLANKHGLFIYDEFTAPDKVHPSFKEVKRTKYGTQ